MILSSVCGPLHNCKAQSPPEHPQPHSELAFRPCKSILFILNNGHKGTRSSSRGVLRNSNHKSRGQGACHYKSETSRLMGLCVFSHPSSFPSSSVKSHLPAACVSSCPDFSWLLPLPSQLTGHFQVPKGGWEPTDVILEAAASREALEEGLTLCPSIRHLIS